MRLMDCYVLCARVHACSASTHRCKAKATSLTAHGLVVAFSVSVKRRSCIVSAALACCSASFCALDKTALLAACYGEACIVSDDVPCVLATHSLLLTATVGSKDAASLSVSATAGRVSAETCVGEVVTDRARGRVLGVPPHRTQSSRPVESRTSGI